jgi:hypothetical protein
MEVKGKVHEIGALQQLSETFKKRDLVIEYAENPTYPEYIKFETMQDKTSLLDSVKVGDEVEVAFNLRGRPWTDKAGKVSYFNSLIIWRLSTLKAGNGDAAPAYHATPPITPLDESDLPF